jgi:hypothetical protein
MMSHAEEIKPSAQPLQRFYLCLGVRICCADNVDRPPHVHAIDKKNPTLQRNPESLGSLIK